MMTYTEHPDNSITLQMSRDQFSYLIFLLGMASGTAARMGDDVLYGSIKFVNELNRTNPNFTPYELPPEPGKGAHE